MKEVKSESELPTPPLAQAFFIPMSRTRQCAQCLYLLQQHIANMTTVSSIDISESFIASFIFSFLQIQYMRLTSGVCETTVGSVPYWDLVPSGITSSCM